MISLLDGEDKNNGGAAGFYEQLYRVTLAVTTGICTGLAAVAFRKMIALFEAVFFGRGEQWLPFLGHYYVILLPALGGLVVGPITYFFAREVKGPGVGEVIASVTVRGGYIRPRVVPLKILASAVCIGSGGSAGRVGPIVHIGAAIGSTLGQLFKVPSRKMRALVACGAAGGIAATFNAPIGGVLFALEVILGDFTGNHLVLVIISSVAAAVVGIIFFGASPAFAVPAYPLNHPLELFLYALLGVACGLFSVYYIKVFYKIEDMFNLIKQVPEYLKPALGGLFVGCIGLFAPHVFGVGFESIEAAIAGKMALETAAALLILKLLATSITIGSGGSGGVFAPGLFMGTMLGATLGYLFHFLFPDVAEIPAAYALVGMGGVIAGSAHAPITAIIMLFEMSNDYHIILPTMIACITSSVVAKTLYPSNVYVVKLIRRGLDVEAARRPDILKNVLVKDVMTAQIETIPAGFACKEAWKLVHGSPHRGFPVINGHGHICGIITRNELEKAIAGGDGNRPVQEIAAHDLVTVTPYEPISVAVKRMNEHDVGRLPVIDPGNEKKVVGLLSRTDIISAYTRGLLQQDELEDVGISGKELNKTG
ncbi:chloride channel protein [Desulfallas sp. Bu1-1]|uniref:chloride channel protein n=1 Tax=Desulfallas sp. Bu1-1 TaxID=2787620 RepID=UPI00189FC4E1|nr:chloride channel protein [Desulfallas sp. Bu1-1]MBF7082043.1 chloride channel protein [Desulfallas sp. Bu1-1]